MRISVLIPAYNSAATIEATLESVFSQTFAAHEILVMDDGSNDNTVELLRRHAPRVTLFQQANQGVAHSRNALVQRASGDLIAFLDHDDVWHRDYLAAQVQRFGEHPDGAAFFTGHKDFSGLGNFEWKNEPGALEMGGSVEVIEAVDFLWQYHRTIGKFASMSFCCIPREKLQQLGPQPFCPEVTGVDDFYIFHKLMLSGPIIYSPRVLAAYRITSGNQSASLLKSVQKAVRAMELLGPYFQAKARPQLRKEFNAAYAAQRREYGRVLMGAGQPGKARKELVSSLGHSWRPVSLAKSLVWLFFTAIPRSLQPKWPADLKISHAQMRQIQPSASPQQP